MTVQLDVSYRCDLNCVHCYLDNRTTWPELMTAEWLRVLDQLAHLGTLFLVWSGGDVLQRADFNQLLAAACRLGFVSRIKTHAGAVTPATAALWAASRVARVDVSVYSLVPEVHDNITRSPGSLAATLRGIGCLIAEAVPVRVSVSVLDQTVDEIAALYRGLTALGCAVEFNMNVMRDLSASSALDNLNLSPENRIRAEKLVWEHTRVDRALPASVSTRQDSGPCGAGRTLGYISPDGALWPCVMFPMQLGHTREQSIAQIWRDSPQRQALAAWTNRDRTGCQSCGGSGLCFYCPGEAFKTTGDFKVAPPHFHTRTRHAMQGYEAARGPTFSAEDWASVPAGGAHPPRPDKFVFPIYRPRKGNGARVGKPAP